MNRLNGRLDLVYDAWLYPVFEAIGLAQPRSIWLERALTDGSVQYVITTAPEPHIDGISQRLPGLGYFPKYQIGPFYAWERSVLLGITRGGAGNLPPGPATSGAR
jgi:hypothetical protein